MKKTIIIITAVAVLIALSLGLGLGLTLNKGETAVDAKQTIGVWWWDNRLDDTYLDFAASQGVTEIYYYASSFSERISDFIGRANKKNIKVYWLTGKYEWIENPDPLYELISEYETFQSTSGYNCFSGIHFDIEPHQHPDFETKRTQLISSFVLLAKTLAETYPEFHISYDLPFWLEDEIAVGGVTKPAFQFIIDYASSVTLMSYRDSADGVLSVSEEEIEYAKKTGKTLNLGVETGENSDDIVTFFEEGSAYMTAQLKCVRAAIPSPFGIAVHHVKSWKELKK